MNIERLRENLPGYSAINYVDSTGSTNTDLLNSDAGHKSVLIAGEQTAGKGRLGRAWSSPKGAQFICSIALIVGERDVERLGTLPLAVGVALTDAIPTAELKWPNDVLIDGRKLVGILAEGTSLIDGQFRVVVGFGINVGLTREQLPVEHATSLLLEGLDTDLTELGERVLTGVEKRLFQWQERDPQLMADYRRVSATIGKRVRLETPQGDVFGLVDDVADDGRVIVDGQAYSAGDVTHLRPES